MGFLLCPRGESPLTYMPAITGEMVLGVSDERGSEPVDQVNDDRVHAEDAQAWAGLRWAA